MAINRISLCLGLLTLVTDILSPYAPDILQMFTPAESSALAKVCLLILQLCKCLRVCVCLCVIASHLYTTCTYRKYGCF